MEPGQNKADSWTSRQKPDWQLSKKIQAWYDEVSDFPEANVASFSSKGATGTIGHYTQLVWGETEFIGCGAIYYKDNNFPRYPYRKTLVCNYHPPGNYLNHPVYQAGQTAVDCTNGSENGLCL